MKKITIAFAVLLATFASMAPTFAQEVKKVAILPVVDLDGVFYGGQKMAVGDDIARAVDNTPGYEAYDRVDLRAIFGEHDFQRSGYVSDDQIKAIGRASGCQYVLVVRMGKYSQTEVSFSAKLIDIETLRRKESSDAEITTMEPQRLKQSVQRVIAQLLGGQPVVKHTNNPANGYVDLGLPSGTKWKDKNQGSGFYSYDEAVRAFGNSLPTKEQFEELKNFCEWTWTAGGYKVTGENGNSIFLPTSGSSLCDGDVSGVGSCGIYWSSTPDGSDRAWGLYVGSGGVVINRYYRCYGLSVRLVQD